MVVYTPLYASNEEAHLYAKEVSWKIKKDLLNGIIARNFFRDFLSSISLANLWL